MHAMLLAASPTPDTPRSKVLFVANIGGPFLPDRSVSSARLTASSVPRRAGVRQEDGVCRHADDDIFLSGGFL